MAAATDQRASDQGSNPKPWLCFTCDTKNAPQRSECSYCKQKRSEQVALRNDPKNKYYFSKPTVDDNQLISIFSKQNGSTLNVHEFSHLFETVLVKDKYKDSSEDVFYHITEGGDQLTLSMLNDCKSSAAMEILKEEIEVGEHAVTWGLAHLKRAESMLSINDLKAIKLKSDQFLQEKGLVNDIKIDPFTNVEKHLAKSGLVDKIGFIDFDGMLKQL